MVILVQTISDHYIHILFDDRQAESDRFQPLAAGPAVFINLDLLNQGFHQLPALFLIHQTIKLLKVNQDLIDVVAGDLLGLNGLFLGFGFNESLLLFIDLIIHAVQPVIQVRFAAAIVPVIRIQLLDFFYGLPFDCIGLLQLLFQCFDFLVNGGGVHLHIDLFLHHRCKAGIRDKLRDHLDHSGIQDILPDLFFVIALIAVVVAVAVVASVSSVETRDGEGEKE